MKEIILKEAIGVVMNLVASWAKQERAHVKVSFKQTERALTHHLAYVDSWSGQISLRDIPRSRSLSDVFVRLSLSDRRFSAKRGKLTPEYLLRPGLNNVLLGHPGSGKTTTIKYLCQHLLHEPPTEADCFAFPLLTRLRDIKPKESLVEHLLRILDVHIRFEEAEPANAEDSSRRLDEYSVKERILVEYVNKTGPILLLDGLDEMHPTEAVRIRAELQRLANLLVTAKFVVTCRIGALDIAFDNSETLIICPFDRDQIKAFATSWLGSSSQAEAFLNAVDRSPYSDTVRRPLILVNLCMLYDAYGELPEPPIMIYLKVVQLLLEEWDRQRELRRLSRYAQFGPERKRHFLAALAYWLATYYRSGSKYDEGELKGAFRNMHSRFGLPLAERDRVLSEIESHTGLFVKTGFNQFEFSHKSLQEFLCADHLSRLPGLSAHLMQLIGIPNECAVATSLSSDPNGFFTFLVFELCGRCQDTTGGENDLGLSQFWNRYLTRLLVERVAFTKDVVLGIAFLTLCAEAWRPDYQVENRVRAVEGFDTFVDLLDQVYSQPIMKSSVREACKLYFRAASSENCVECRVKEICRSQLPPSAPERIVVHRKFTADTLL